MTPFTLMHTLEALYYIPVSLLFYFLAVRLAQRAMDPRFASALCILSAAAIFGASNVKMSGVTEAAPRGGGTPYIRDLRALGDGGEAAAFHRSALRDFDAVRAIAPRDAKVFVATGRRVKDITAFSGARSALYFYLSGYVINHCGDRFDEGAEYRPDFILSRERIDSPFLLTRGTARCSCTTALRGTPGRIRRAPSRTAVLNFCAGGE